MFKEPVGARLNSDASLLLRRRAFVSQYGDRARDARDHDDRIVQVDRSDREIDSGPLEWITHLAENDVIGRDGIGRETAARGIVISARGGKGGGDRWIDRQLLADRARCCVRVR